MSEEAIASVIVASAQSVAKVFVIGGIGYGAVLLPRGAPFLPRTSVGTVARFTFHTLTLSLIYSTIAVAVSPQSIGNYWFLIVGGWVVLGTSYLVATVLRCIIPINSQEDFIALRVAATFPNIVAIPILIQPSLCEFPVVYEGFAGDYVGAFTEEPSSGDALRRECVAQSTTMIFCYFFAWSLAFWSFGYPQLMRAAKANNQSHQISPGITPDGNSHHTTRSSVENSNSSNDSNQFHHERNNSQNGLNFELMTIDDAESRQQPNDEWSSESGREAKNNSGVSAQSPTVMSCSCPPSATTASSAPAPASRMSQIWNIIQPVWQAVKQTTTSPGFLAMLLAFITACIPPLQRALFEPGGSLRFLGSAVEALGTASSPISTMVVAASLVPPEPLQDESAIQERQVNDENDVRPVFEEQPGMTDPNFGPYRRPACKNRRPSRFREFGRSLRSSSIRILQAVPRSTPEMRRLHVWYTLSRLVVAPAAVVGFLLAFDCSSSTVLDSVPNLAKFVIVMNASLPGALIVVVLLKANEECADTAAAVSKVYLPSYVLSIFTIAAWCAVGLWITIPDEEGNTFCQR